MKLIRAVSITLTSLLWIGMLADVHAAQPARFAPDSMAYVLQADKLDSRPSAVAALAASGRDLVVLDYAYDSKHKWTPEELAAIRKGKPGRSVVAYLSVGEAENYRWYWRKAWDENEDGTPDTGAPSFLEAQNPGWAGNYKVRYWRKDWQELVLAYVDEIVTQGFDGAYLDIVDAFEFFEKDPKTGSYVDDRENAETRNTFRQDMVAWVKKIAKHARRSVPGFLIIPQNGSQLLSDPSYVEIINGIGVEDLFTGDCRRKRAPEYDYRLRALASLKRAHKPVLVIEYSCCPSYRQFAKEKVREHGLVLLITDRALTGLGRAPN